MIPVALQPEPDSFDQQVRQLGNQWLASNPTATAENYPPYWRKCLADLHTAYSGICAYVGTYINPTTGASSVDHFVAKSRRPDLAYEWANYRLACLRMNARKRDFDDVLDPFTISENRFQLVLLTGEIKPAFLNDVDALNTIQRLGLDQENFREERYTYFLDYLKGEISADYLCRRAPFVYQEAVRQGQITP